MALASVFCIMMLEAFQDKSYYAELKWYICTAFIVIGAVVVYIGQRLNTTRRRERAQRASSGSNSDEDSSGEEPFILFNLAYWGVIIIMFGVIIVFIVPTFHKKAEKVVARVPPRVTNVVAAPTNREPVAPTFKLQGLVYRKSNSSILIEGRTYFIGDTIGDAKIIAIGTNTATIDWHGKEVVLHAPD